MAFNSSNFNYNLLTAINTIDSTKQMVLWSYSTTDSTSTVNSTGYFNSIETDNSNPIRIGDWIAVKASDGVEVVVCTNAVSGVTIEQIMFVSSATTLNLFSNNIF